MALNHYQRTEQENLFLGSVNCLYSFIGGANFWNLVQDFENFLLSKGFVYDETNLSEIHRLDFGKISILVSSSAVALISPAKTSSDLCEFLRLNDLVIDAFEAISFDGFSSIMCVRIHTIKLNIRELGMAKEDASAVLFSENIRNSVCLEERENLFTLAQLMEKENDGVVEFSLSITSTQTKGCELHQLRPVVASLSEMEYDMWRTCITNDLYSASVNE